MKSHIASLVILSALSALLTMIGGCHRNNSEVPKATLLTCPSGSKLVGGVPPDEDEQACWETVSGEQVKNGPMIIYRPNGFVMMEGNYAHGKQDGEWTMYYESGGKKSIDHYKDGVQSGDHVSWYEDGQIDAKGQYKDGSQDGVWKRWGPDGIKNWEETYKDGKKVS